MSALRNSLAQRILAIGAAQRLHASMENDGDLDQESLDEVARKASESMPGETADTAEVPPADDTASVDETADLGESAPTETPVEETELPVDETAPAEDTGTETDPTAEQIETPTEQVVEDLGQDGSAEDASIADGAVAEAGEATADPIPGADDLGGEVAPTEEAPAADVVAEEAPVAEAPVDDAAPADAAVAEEATVPLAAQPPQEEAPQQAAEAPSATQDSEAALNVANLLESVASARNAHDVVEQARETSDALTGIGETADAINETGGMSMEAYAMLMHAVGHYEKTLDRPLLSNVGLESFAGTPRKVSLESIADAVRELEGNLPVMERQAVESLDRIRDGVLDALPTIRARLHDIISQATLVDSTNGHDLQLDAALAAAMSIDGQVPESLGDALVGYTDLGSRILGRYSETAFRSAREASMLNNAVDFSSLSAFWERMGPKIQSIRDPRHELTTDHLVKSLPGGSRLFDNSPAMSTPQGSEVLAGLVRFVTENVPMEASVMTASVAGASTKALSCSMIVHIAQRMLEVLDECKIKAVFAEGAKIWPEAQDSVRFLRETFRDGPDDIVNDPSGHLHQVIKFVETAYSLTTWPIVNYLANAVITANAFVSLAVESMKPVEATPADPGVIVQDPVVEEAPPVEAPVVETPVEEVPPAEELAADDTAPAEGDAVADDAALDEGGEEVVEEEPEPSETSTDDLEGESADPELDDFEGDAEDLDEDADEELLKL